MGHAIFELESISKLPLWAQVLMAARMARRAVMVLPAGVSASTRETLTEGCDAIERCAVAGAWGGEDKELVAKAMRHQPACEAHGATLAVYYAGDATHAAYDSSDFSAAESACTESVRKSLAAACGAKGLNPLQAMTLIAADLEVLRFACKEGGIGKYEGLGAAVMGRMFPVTAPENGEVAGAPDVDQFR